MQSYFNVNAYSNPPNGIHGTVSTRDRLRTYDPVLYQLVEEVFPCNNVYLKRCETSRGMTSTLKYKHNANHLLT